jgi:2-hydroxy-3-oxopropionate reductase
MAQRVGFIRLGIMGAPMARNLLKAGFSTTVCSRTASKVAALVAAGAAGASSPREVAERSDVVVTMLPDTPDVQSVVLGPNGVMAGGHRDLVLVDMSTTALERLSGVGSTERDSQPQSEEA